MRCRNKPLETCTNYSKCEIRDGICRIKPKRHGKAHTMLELIYAKVADGTFIMNGNVLLCSLVQLYQYRPDITFNGFRILLSRIASWNDYNSYIYLKPEAYEKYWEVVERNEDKRGFANNYQPVYDALEVPDNYYLQGNDEDYPQEYDENQVNPLMILANAADEPVYDEGYGLSVLADAATGEYPPPPYNAPFRFGLPSLANVATGEYPPPEYKEPYGYGLTTLADVAEELKDDRKYWDLQQQ